MRTSNVTLMKQGGVWVMRVGYWMGWSEDVVWLMMMAPIKVERITIKDVQ